jgi:uncharacterized protein
MAARQNSREGEFDNLLLAENDLADFAAHFFKAGTCGFQLVQDFLICFFDACHEFHYSWLIKNIFGSENGVIKTTRVNLDTVIMTPTVRDASNPLQGLKDVVRGAKGHPPVHLWNPPFCGDIDMRIARDGTWFYMNSPIGRKPLFTLFASVLRHDEDGKYYLVTPVEKCGIIVDDAPFVAIRMKVEGKAHDQIIHFETNVDDEVVVDAAHPLRFETEAGTDGLKPYVLMRARLEALVSRALFYDLVAIGSVHEGWFGVWSSGVFFPMQRADEIQ